MHFRKTIIISSFFIVLLAVVSCSKDSDPDLSSLTISISEYDINVSEIAIGNTGAELNKPAPISISFTISCTGSATEGMDYILTNGKNYTIEAGSEYIPIDWQIINDDIIEEKENLIIRIVNVEPSSISIEDVYTQLTINSDE